jgi:hypothetical protein
LPGGHCLNESQNAFDYLLSNHRIITAPANTPSFFYHHPSFQHDCDFSTRLSDSSDNFLRIF